jgi:hypothetical protein
MDHIFTGNIKSILKGHFGNVSEAIFEKSFLIKYVNEKTRSANKGSKSRGSFGALYSIYTLVEDYISRGFFETGNYSDFEGARQTQLIDRQRELPFGKKLQNHYFQNRTNTDYRKFFPTADIDRVIIHDQAESRYWINEAQLRVEVAGVTYNIAKAVIDIIDEYIKTKQDAFDRFLQACQELQKLKPSESSQVEEFIKSQLAPFVDARLFEIISFAILKYFYHNTKIYWGYDRILEELREENLTLYKTGRTNANDGGIDYVMKPLGRFFQVTETTDFKKYFLDIDKLERYPITFVIKSLDSIDELRAKIESDALKAYSVKAIVTKYMTSIEEIINIPVLIERFGSAIQNGFLQQILDEIVRQSKVEFNYEDLGEEDEEDENGTNE